MTRAAPDTDDTPQLRRGWTTGACATAATKAALTGLWTGQVPDQVQITLPRGETPIFQIASVDRGDGWVRCGVTKDAGDDPDVTHGALIQAEVREGRSGVEFRAGDGVGTVTLEGLPIPPGEPAINPVPRQMMRDAVAELATQQGRATDIQITVSIPGGQELAAKTWNPRLGIKGGLSILGTTGIVRPFSCAAWIASIHRGVDVARAAGVPHVAGCTGATSERTVQGHFDLPDQAMLDMGDFVGGLLKYARRHPVPRITIGGGIGKMTKLAQGAIDLHSGRSQVDFDALAKRLGEPDVAQANTALAAWRQIGQPMADAVAQDALATCRALIQDAPTDIDIIIIDREGAIIAQAS